MPTILKQTLINWLNACNGDKVSVEELAKIIEARTEGQYTLTRKNQETKKEIMIPIS